jgi:hypothetical protein
MTLALTTRRTIETLSPGGGTLRDITDHDDSERDSTAHDHTGHSSTGHSNTGHSNTGHGTRRTTTSSGTRRRDAGAGYRVAGTVFEAWHWSLVRLTPTSADVIVQGSRAHPSEEDCEREVNDLIDLCTDCMISVQHPDGWWFWIIYGADGEPVAYSGQFPTAAECAVSLHQIRHELSTGVEFVLGTRGIMRQRTRKTLRPGKRRSLAPDDVHADIGATVPRGDDIRSKHGLDEARPAAARRGYRFDR